jgi:hypothetical protein
MLKINIHRDEDRFMADYEEVSLLEDVVQFFAFGFAILAIGYLFFRILFF